MVARLFSNAKVGKKIAIALLVPLVGMIAFSGVLTWKEVRLVDNLEHLEAATKLGIHMSNLVHEQQKERGATAVFLGSKGTKFRSELSAQRQVTNEKRTILGDYLAAFKRDEFDATFNKKLDDVLGTLAKMDDLRMSVDSLNIKAPDAIGYYTGLNGKNLDLIGYMAQMSADPAMSIAIVGYANFLQGKERAGIERAVGANGFAAGSFTPKASDKFKLLVAAQDTYNSIFLGFATESQKQLYNEVMNATAAQEVDRMRKVAMAGGLTGELEGIDPKYWFDTITQKINGLKKIEDSLAEDLIVLEEEIIHAVVTEETVTIIASIVASILAILLGWFSIRSISRPVIRITDVIKKLADENTDVELPEVTKDEIGQMVEAMDVLKDAVTKGIRQQGALGAVTSNVMMADENNVIIYVNPAVAEMLRGAQEDIRKELPNFNIDTLVGTSIDEFHKNPSHQHGMLKDLSKSYETSITIAGRTFDLIATPVFNKRKERMGTVVEWSDVTLELAIEEEVANVVEATTRGNFNQRLDTEGKEGFMLKLSEGMNQIGEVSLKGLSEVVKVLNSLSQGHLTDKIEGEYEGLFDEIKQALNDTIEKLQDMVGKIQHSAGSVNSAANEISSGSADLSHRTEQQASTLEETAASMEEMTATVRQNSENASKANDTSNEASKVATKGGEVVEQAVEAMSKIEESSKKIADIIGVIDEIAFQTNLLALNAAVEAARAGDAGKGFAVVASEVRSLAGRSAEASKDIKELIGESVNQVSEGSELVNQAGETLQQIVDSVQQAAKVIEEIAEASQEQATSIEEINTAVTQMDEGTQQNAALVQENTAAAQSLVDQSEDLEQLMSFFKLDESEEASPESERIVKLSEAREEKSAPTSTPPKPMKKAAGAENYDQGWEEF